MITQLRMGLEYKDTHIKQNILNKQLIVLLGIDPITQSKAQNDEESFL
jgi:hypothetical protein